MILVQVYEVIHEVDTIIADFTAVALSAVKDSDRTSEPIYTPISTGFSSRHDNDKLFGRHLIKLHEHPESVMLYGCVIDSTENSSQGRSDLLVLSNYRR